MYLKWAEKIITDFSDSNINSLYNEGFLFTRTGRGEMYQTRSLRIDLNKFELSSENRRVLKKTEDLGLKTYDIPYVEYDWKIGKMAKDFYTTKFGEGTFSANKVKELLTTKHNFNKLLVYKTNTPCLSGRQAHTPLKGGTTEECAVGYCICFENKEILHYSYPFYFLLSTLPNLGMSMMLQTILYAKEHHVKSPDGDHVVKKKYIYLGSAKDAKAKYKLQFEGLEWFDGKIWQTNIEELKNVLK